MQSIRTLLRTPALRSGLWMQQQQGMATGTVKWFNMARGFGFIVEDGGAERESKRSSFFFRTIIKSSSNLPRTTYYSICSSDFDSDLGIQISQGWWGSWVWDSWKRQRSSGRERYGSRRNTVGAYCGSWWSGWLVTVHFRVGCRSMVSCFESLKYINFSSMCWQ